MQQKPRYTVLIVEDNVEMLAFVVRQLSPVYQILTATNGVGGLKGVGGAYSELNSIGYNDARNGWVGIM